MAESEIDQRAARSAFERAAAGYEQAAVVQAEVRGRLLERLALTTLAPAWILDLGAGPGRALKPLVNYARGAEVVAADAAFGMLARAPRRRPWFRHVNYVCARAERLPFAAASFDLVFSNLMLQWCPATERAFSEIRRVLGERALFLFTTFGPDTLKELRAAWADVDELSHVHRFEDMHDLGDALVRSGFVEPVMDVEYLTVTYRTLRDLMCDLKAVGAANVASDRRRSLTGTGRFAAVEQAYERFRENDRLPATYEVVYGTAWTPVTLPRR